MGYALLSRIEAAERGDRLGSRLAVDGKSLRPLKGFDLGAGAAEVVSVLHVQPAEAVPFEKLFELADVVADAAPLENAGEDELSLALGDLGFRPERRSAERVPRVAGKWELDHSGVAAPRLDHVEVGIGDVAYVGGFAVLVDLEHEIADAEPVLRQLFALVVKPVSGKIVAENARHVLKPVHSETGAVERAEHVAESRLTLLLPEGDSPLRVGFVGLAASDPRLGDRIAKLALRSPDVYGMVLYLLMKMSEKSSRGDA